jgi:uncharacterized protein YeaO (DUF488 family)
MIIIKRVYDSRESSEGKVFLVDRIWPRGIRKADLKIDGWLKEVAPTAELRRWFHQKPDQWQEFKRQYYKELDRIPEAWKPILKAAQDGDITLLYSSKNREHNNAVALKAYLEEKLG